MAVFMYLHAVPIDGFIRAYGPYVGFMCVLRFHLQASLASGGRLHANACFSMHSMLVHEKVGKCMHMHE